MSLLPYKLLSQCAYRKVYHLRKYIFCYLLVVVSLNLLLENTVFPSTLRGNLQLVGVKSDNLGIQTQSLDQKHSINWSKLLTSFTTFDASFGYQRFSSDLGEGGNVWQKQVNLSSSLRWSFPLFTASVVAQKRNMFSSNQLTDIVQNQVVSSFKLKKTNFPTLLIRHNYDESYNKYNRQTRDIIGQTFQLVTQQTIGTSNFGYSFNRNQQNIYSSDLKSLNTSHNFNWTQYLHLADSRIIIQNSYRINHRRQTDLLINADETVRTIDIVAGLYSLDATPDLSSLDTIIALSDGNISEPVTPSIDIGRGKVDHNIGIDFGYTRLVSGIYIYTDQPSGSLLDWIVYTSSDNEFWTQIFSGVQVEYNAAILRYEIIFEDTNTRYIKVVNRGINDILDVKVSEIIALERIDINSETTRTQTVHQLNTGINYKLSNAITMGLDFNLRNEPQSSFSNSRNHYFSSYSFSYKPSEVLSQSIRIQVGWNRYKNALKDERDFIAFYSLSYTPLKTLDILFGANTRQSYIGGHNLQKINSLSVRSQMKLLNNLSLIVNSQYSRNNLILAQQEFDNWTFGISSDIKLTRAIDLLINTRYRSSKDLEFTNLRIQRTIDGMIDVRFTSKITYSSRFSINDDNNSYSTSQHHTFIWWLAEPLSLGAQYDHTRSSRNVQVERKNVRINYRFNRQSQIFIAINDISSNNDISRNIFTFQVGLKSGF